MSQTISRCIHTSDVVEIIDIICHNLKDLIVDFMNNVYRIFHCISVDFFVGLIAIDTNGAALVVGEIRIIRAVVALDIIFAILESLMPAFSIAGVVIDEDDIVS